MLIDKDVTVFYWPSFRFPNNFHKKKNSFNYLRINEWIFRFPFKQITEKIPNIFKTTTKSNVKELTPQHNLIDTDYIKQCCLRESLAGCILNSQRTFLPHIPMWCSLIFPPQHQCTRYYNLSKHKYIPAHAGS